MLAKAHDLAVCYFDLSALLNFITLPLLATILFAVRIPLSRSIMDDSFALWFALCTFILLLLASAVDGFLDAADLTLGDTLSALPLALCDSFHRFYDIFDRNRIVFDRTGDVFICVWDIVKTIICIYFEIFVLFLWLALELICLFPTLAFNEAPSPPSASTSLTSTTLPPSFGNEEPFQEIELALPPRTVYKHFPAYWSPAPTVSKAYAHSPRSQEVSMYENVDILEYGMQYVNIHGSRRLVPMAKEMLEESQDKTQVNIQLVDQAVVSYPTPVPSVSASPHVSNIHLHTPPGPVPVPEPVVVTQSDALITNPVPQVISTIPLDTYQNPAPMPALTREAQFTIACQTFTAVSAQLDFHVRQFIDLSFALGNYQWHMNVIISTITDALRILQTFFPNGMPMQILELSSFYACIELLWRYMRWCGYEISHAVDPALRPFVQQIYDFGQFLALDIQPLDMTPLSIIEPLVPIVPTTSAATLQPEGLNDTPYISDTFATPTPQNPLAEQSRSQQPPPTPSFQHPLGAVPQNSFHPPPQMFFGTTPSASFGGTKTNTSAPAKRNKRDQSARKPVKKAPQQSLSTALGSAMNMTIAPYDFSEQNWSLPMDQLLKIKKEDWGWTDDELFKIRMQEDLVPQFDVAGHVPGRTLSAIEYRISPFLAENLKTGIIILRMQIFSLRQDKEPELLQDITKLLHDVDRLVQDFCSDATRKDQFVHNGDFSAFATQFWYLKDIIGDKLMVQLKEDIWPEGEANLLKKRIERNEVHFRRYRIGPPA